MNETPKYVKEVQHILANIHENGNSNQDTEPHELTPPENEIDMYVEEDRITFIPRRLHGIPVNEQDIVDSVAEELDTTPLQTQPAKQPTSNVATGILPFGVFVILFCIMSIMFQLYVIANPFTVTVTLVAKSQQLSLQGTLKLGRVLNPITLSQSQTVPTTGKGHQDARSATGTITFYNGLFTQQFVAQGTAYTGSDGVQIVTTQDATIPPGNPTTGYGTVTVTAQAQQSGTSGNITAGDITITINNGLLVRNNPFHGGQDERSYQVVTKTDITNAVAPLKANLAQSVQGALQGQLKTNESLVTPSCTTTTTADHQPGEEATTVKVSVSETCSAVAYDQDALQAKVTDLLNRQAEKRLGAGYSILGNPEITITQANIQNSKVVLSFSSQSTWVYALSSTEQKHIKNIIAGKTRDKAMQLLASLPGIESKSIQSSGFGDDAKIPKDAANIHLVVIYV